MPLQSAPVLWWPFLGIIGTTVVVAIYIFVIAVFFARENPQDPDFVGPVKAGARPNPFDELEKGLRDSSGLSYSSFSLVDEKETPHSSQNPLAASEKPVLSFPNDGLGKPSGSSRVLLMNNPLKKSEQLFREASSTTQPPASAGQHQEIRLLSAQRSQKVSSVTEQDPQKDSPHRTGSPNHYAQRNMEDPNQNSYSHGRGNPHEMKSLAGQNLQYGNTKPQDPDEPSAMEDDYPYRRGSRARNGLPYSKASLVGRQRRMGSAAYSPNRSASNAFNRSQSCSDGRGLDKLELGPDPRASS